MQSDKFILKKKKGKKKNWDTWPRSKNTTAVDFKIGRVENGYDCVRWPSLLSRWFHKRGV